MINLDWSNSQQPVGAFVALIHLSSYRYFYTSVLFFTVKIRQNRAMQSQASSEPKEIAEKMTELVIDVPEISESRVKNQF